MQTLKGGGINIEILCPYSQLWYSSWGGAELESEIQWQDTCFAHRQLESQVTPAQLAPPQSHCQSSISSILS